MAKQNKQLDKFAIAAALQEIAALMELKGGTNKFKARAYNAGARSIAGVSGDLGDLVEEDRLTTLPGIGNALATQIKQLYLTGESSVLKALRQEFPPGIIELSGVPGLSVAKIKQLHEGLGISSIEELKGAAEAGRIRALKGFGQKTESKLLETLSDHAKRSRKPKRLHLHRALGTAEQVQNYLSTARGLKKLSFAGSLRRWNETVGTIKLVASTNEPGLLLQHFLRFPLIVQTENHSQNRATVVFAEGSRVSLVAVPPDEFAATLFAETGSTAHVSKIAKLLSEGSATKRRGKTRQVELSEVDGDAEIYHELGLPYITPELREDTGEIEAALKNKLPLDLIEISDIRGMVHCHTTYSDGKHSIEEMALAAEAMGMDYITITDHSPTAFYAGGVELDRLQRQWEEIDQVQEKVKVKLLRGTESDILANGALDYPDKVLEMFDVIVASVHSRYKMDSEKMTRRVVTAMQQPVFKIWGHAQGRLIQSRPPFDCDMLHILDVIAESNAAVEINGDPFRLDMEPRWVREARKRKIKFVISVDAHSTRALHNVKYGVAMARRGWVRKGEVLNALPLPQFRKAVKPV
ncbi:MAG TPA: DNA polymerase/3'-5' exonuclease PolX [Pyrinomonadaceae bacterium]|jgi:DNA polymerase (family 10)